MTRNAVHSHDTPLSSFLRFVCELIAWTGGPWAAAQVSAWLIVPTLIVLVGLPSVFSTIGDKRTIVVATPGPVRVVIELLLYAVAAGAPWLVWPASWAMVATLFVVASSIAGVPRFVWLLREQSLWRRSTSS